MNRSPYVSGVPERHSVFHVAILPPTQSRIASVSVRFMVSTNFEVAPLSMASDRGRPVGVHAESCGVPLSNISIGFGGLSHF